VVFYRFKRFKEDMRTLEDDARTGHTATALNLETIAKECELVTTHCCMSLKLMENQVQVDFESDVLNYCLGPITWNYEGIKGTWIVWDTFLHALYIQSDTDSYSKFPFTSSSPHFLTMHFPVISPWIYLWPVFFGIYCSNNLCLISEPKFPCCFIMPFISLT
jgi:hypothetical protein